MIPITPQTRLRTARLAGLLLVLVGVSGCGERTVLRGTTEPDQGDDNVQSLAVATYERIWGTAPEKEAAHYLGWRAMTDPISTCMDARGAHYYRRFEPIWNGWTAQPLGDLLAPLGWRQSTRALAEAAEIRDDADERRPPAYVTTDSYRQDATDCEKSMGDPTKWDSPPGVEELDDAFDKVVAQATADVGGYKAYTECMRTVGITVGDEGLGETLRQEMPLPPLPGETPSQEWGDYLSLEGDALAADRDCRSDTFHAGMQLLKEPLENFVAEHSAELNSTEETWRAILTQAMSMGFNPDNPEVID